jgi:hypothetical protein
MPTEQQEQNNETPSAHMLKESRDVMKSYLLTWYGITDLRAALGFEELGGPVMAALKTGNYTDVMILAYTEPSKPCQDSVKEYKQMAQDGVDLTRQQQANIVSAISNTMDAHRVFRSWLKEALQGLGINVNIQLCAKELAFLNDSKGIYDAVIQALDVVQADVGQKEITFYLSPGTPIMAFNWAFVSMTNPEMNIKVIACSDIRNPPEVVALPYELMAPSNRRSRSHGLEGNDGFDVIFHLFGDQRMPSLFGILQFPCTRHIFITSEKYRPELMEQFMVNGSECERVNVNPFDPMSTKVAVLKAVANIPNGKRVGFNLTGGTKLMFAGAIAACRKIGGAPFYFETKDHNLIFLDDFTTMPMRGVDNLDMFFHANGFTVVNKGNWADCDIRSQRKPLTQKLWEERAGIAQLYARLVAPADFDGDEFIVFNLKQDVKIKGQVVTVEASLDKDGQAFFDLGGAKFAYQYCPDFAKYLAGCWLEEYTYLILEPGLHKGKIRDLRIGLKVCWDDMDRVGAKRSAQEFDVVFTDGKRLFIIECKAGSVTSEHVYKLQNCVQNYGGVDAHGIMVSAFPPHSQVTRKRLSSAANLSLLSDWDVPNKLVDRVKSLL